MAYSRFPDPFYIFRQLSNTIETKDNCKLVIIDEESNTFIFSTIELKENKESIVKEITSSIDYQFFLIEIINQFLEDIEKEFQSVNH